MPTFPRPLRDEHRDLMPGVERLRSAAEAVGEVPLALVRSQVGRAVEFLTGRLLPHADAEERGLYPVVARLMGAPEATRTMCEDHLEIARLTVELQVLEAELLGPEIAAPAAHELRRVLYALHTLITTHFLKEEKVYLPMLEERLTPGEAIRMFRAMERVAREARTTQAVIQKAG